MLSEQCREGVDRIVARWYTTGRWPKDVGPETILIAAFEELVKRSELTDDERRAKIDLLTNIIVWYLSRVD